ncbi:hypothetical protein Tco_0568785 [Tanacetum coccineum]
MVRIKASLEQRLSPLRLKVENRKRDVKMCNDDNAKMTKECPYGAEAGPQSGGLEDTAEMVSEACCGGTGGAADASLDKERGVIWSVLALPARPKLGVCASGASESEVELETGVPGADCCVEASGSVFLGKGHYGIQLLLLAGSCKSPRDALRHGRMVMRVLRMVTICLCDVLCIGVMRWKGEWGWKWESVIACYTVTIAAREVWAWHLELAKSDMRRCLIRHWLVGAWPADDYSVISDDEGEDLE